MSGGIRDDLGWIAIGVPAVLVLAFLLSVSVQATAACALVLLVIGLHQYDRVWGIYAMFALWFLAPGLRRVLGLFTGYVENDPLSLAPFIATAAIAALELVQVHMPSRIRLIMLMAALGFAIGLPVGMLTGPRAAVYAVTAYIAGLSAVILGFNERGRLLKSSTLRTVLVYGLPAIAAIRDRPAGVHAPGLGPVLARQLGLQQHRRLAHRRGARVRHPEQPGRAGAPALPLPALLPERQAQAPLGGGHRRGGPDDRHLADARPIGVDLADRGGAGARDRLTGSQRPPGVRRRRGGDRGHPGAGPGEYHRAGRAQPLRDDRQPQPGPVRRRSVRPRSPKRSQGRPSARRPRARAAPASRRSSPAIRRCERPTTAICP